MSDTIATEPAFYSWAERTGYFSGAHHLWAFQSGAGYALVDDAGRLQTWHVDRRAETLDDGAVRVFRTREAAVVWAADMYAMYGWRLSPVTMASPPDSSPALNLWRVELPLYEYAYRAYSWGMRDADKSSSKTDETLDDAPATIRRPVLTFALKRRGTGHVVDAAWCGADEAHAEEVPPTLRCPSMAALPVEVAA